MAAIHNTKKPRELKRMCCRDYSAPHLYPIFRLAANDRETPAQLKSNENAM